MNKFQNRTYVISIWSGKETIKTRVVDQAHTWLKFWDEALVYSDDFYPGDCELIQTIAFPCRIRCIPLQGFSQHLEGTKWNWPWVLAQPRFLPAIARSYELYPNADFFIFGDDDTFFFKQAIINKLKSTDPSHPKAIGRPYCMWPFLNYSNDQHHNCHLFLQGGAGVIMTNKLLSIAGPELLACNRRFNDPFFAGSMRFSVCLRRLVGDKNWSLGRFIHQWQRLHSQTPRVEIEQRPLRKPPGSFHRMQHSDFVWLKERAFVTWKWKDRTFCADLGSVVLIEHQIPMFRIGTYAVWQVGVSLFIPCDNLTLKAKSAWKAVVSPDGNVSAYDQNYERGLTMRLIPDPTVQYGRVVPRSVIGRCNRFEYAISPPEVRDITFKQITR